MSRIRRIARKAGNRLKAAGRRMLGLPAGPAILMYHRVNEPGYDPWELAVTPAHFDEQLAWLKRRRTVLPLVEFAERHARGDLPRDAVAITFDDGYACNGLNAAPLLAAHGLPATVLAQRSAATRSPSLRGSVGGSSASSRQRGARRLRSILRIASRTGSGTPVRYMPAIGRQKSWSIA